MNEVPKRFLVHVRLGQGQPATARIREAASGIQDIIKAISKDEYQLAYTSHDGASFGFFVKTAISADHIRARIESGDRLGDHGSPVRNDDSLLIVELGQDFSGYGLSRAWTWLQHH